MKIYLDKFLKVWYNIGVINLYLGKIVLIRNFSSNSAIDVVEEFKVMGMCNIINTSQSDITISFNAPLINGSHLN